MADLLLTPNYRRITVTLAADEREALRALAFQERRDTRQQAALLIRRELERRGLLATEGPAQEVQHATD
mgnify:CR=1 FL=1